MSSLKFSLKPHPINPEIAGLNNHSITKKISFLKCHFQKIEEVFESEWDDLNYKWEIEMERKKDDEDDSNVNDNYSQSLMEIEYVYLRMHRYSAVLTAYSYLELVLHEICTVLEEKNNILFSVKDLKGNGLGRYKCYLKKVLGIEFSEMEGGESIDILNKVRNCIMHSGGDLRKCKKNIDLSKSIDRNPHLSCVEEHLIMISREFVEEVMDDIERFLSSLLRVCR